QHLRLRGQSHPIEPGDAISGDCVEPRHLRRARVNASSATCSGTVNVGEPPDKRPMIMDGWCGPVKRIIAASLSLMMATAFLAPGAAAQATLDPVAQSKSTTSTTTGKSAPKNSPEKSSTKATGTSASQSTTETSEPTSSSAL